MSYMKIIEWDLGTVILIYIQCCLVCQVHQAYTEGEANWEATSRVLATYYTKNIMETVY